MAEPCFLFLYFQSRENHRSDPPAFHFNPWNIPSAPGATGKSFQSSPFTQCRRSPPETLHFNPHRPHQRAHRRQISIRIVLNDCRRIIISIPTGYRSPVSNSAFQSYGAAVPEALRFQSRSPGRIRVHELVLDEGLRIRCRNYPVDLLVFDRDLVALLQLFPELRGPGLLP